MKQILFISLAAILLSACKKKEPELPPPPQPKITLASFTPTDKNGNITGTADNTDWTYDATWNANENKQFAFADSMDLTGTDTSKIQVLPAYANPAVQGDSLILKIKCSKKVAVAVLVVDEFLTIHAKDKFIMTQPSKINFTLAKNTYDPNTLYRIYYCFSAAGNKLFYKGHGDFKVQ